MSEGARVERAEGGENEGGERRVRESGDRRSGAVLRLLHQLILLHSIE